MFRNSKSIKILIFIIVFALVFSPLADFIVPIKEAQAAVSFVGSCENSAGDGGDVILTLPSMQTNDLVIVSYTIGDNDAVDYDMSMITADYTEVADLFVNGTRNANLGVFWKVMGATPDTTAQVNVDGADIGDASVAAVCMVFRGVDTTTPMDATPNAATGINTMHPDPPTIDHNNPSGIWTVIAGGNAHLLGGLGTYTFPTGYTTNAIDVGADDTNDTTVGMGYRTDPADPESPGVMTHSGLNDAAYAWAAATLALRPAAADLSWDTGAADFEIWAGATATSDASLTWDNGTLICSTSLTDDNTRQSTCGSINKNQKYRVQVVLENIGGTAASMNGAADPVDQKNVKTFWAGTSPTLDTCGFNDIGVDNGATTCTLAFNGNDARITNTGAGNVVIGATTGTEGFMYLITTDSNVSLSDPSTYMNASIDSITEDSSRITIGLKRVAGNYVRGFVRIRGYVKFR